MKRCPRCNQIYDDDQLNFCLNDGELLVTDYGEPPPTYFGGQPETSGSGETPTVFLNPPRVTNQGNWQTAPPPAPWQSQSVQGQQQASAFSRSPDQTLSTVSM